MHEEYDFIALRPDPSWYRKYWYESEPKESFHWARRVFGAVAAWRVANRRSRVPAMLQAQRSRAALDGI
jgi:hypothetical protein